VKTGLTFLQAFRLASKRIVPFACGFAVLFTLCALAQYWFVTRQTRLTTKADLEAVAKRIEQEIAFTNSWNLNGGRRAEFGAGTYYVFTADGFQIEIGEFIPGLVTRVALVETAVYDGPRTVNTPVGETWRLLGKRVSGGSVLLGILDLEDDLKDLQSADKTLHTEGYWCPDDVRCALGGFVHRRQGLSLYRVSIVGPWWKGTSGHCAEDAIAARRGAGAPAMTPNGRAWSKASGAETGHSLINSIRS
jgi:hypothetical protein